MKISYEEAPDIKRKISEIVSRLEMNHIPLDRVYCIRSKGSSSRNIIARCHALPKIMQQCLNVPASYIIEIISENFDDMNDDEKIRTLIHELLHIPKTFGGGFKHHNTISKRKVESLFKRFNIFSVGERKI